MKNSTDLFFVKMKSVFVFLLLMESLLFNKATAQQQPGGGQQPGNGGSGGENVTDAEYEEVK